jgi:hypothetical protein
MSGNKKILKVSIPIAWLGERAKRIVDGVSFFVYKHKINKSHLLLFI